jgi:hypothetical protein
MTERFSNATVSLRKLRDYCLSERHPRGRHKARTFRTVLGLTAADASRLRRELIAAVRQHENELRASRRDQYGERYVLDFSLKTEAGAAIIRSAWIVRPGESVLRLTTCYVLQEQE